MTEISVQQLLELRRPTDAAVSPDGAALAVVVAEPGGVDPALGARARLWIADGEASPQPWTEADGLYAVPRWSPVERELAFASDRAERGRMSLYTIGAAEAAVGLGSIDGSVEDLVWSADGSCLLVLAADLGLDSASAHNATAIGRSVDADPAVFRPGRRRRRLYLVSRHGGATVELPLDGLSVWAFGWDARSRAAAIVSADASESGWYTASLVVIETRPPGSIRARHQPAWQLGAPRVSPDGRRVAFIEGLCSDRGIVSGMPMVAEIGDGTLAPRLLGGLSNVTDLHWRDQRTVWFAGWAGAGSACGVINIDGEVTELWRGEATLGPRLAAQVSVDRAGRRLVAIKEASNVPPEVAELDQGGGGWRDLTAFNERLRRLTLPRWETRRWRSGDGLQIEGLVALPREEPAERLPAVVLLHGGPTSSWTHQWTNFGWPTLWTAAGYAVLMPNPRGSVGYGQEFVRATRYDMGGGELRDVLAGIDALADAGVIDPGRVGVLGASHGGYLAAWAVTQTMRFAAGIAIAAPCNRLSKYNTGNIGYLEELFWDPNPYDPAGAVIARSPIMHVGKAATPLLIVHGALDRCVPVSQAHELYQGLARTAAAPVELVVYPREGHSIREREHLVDFWSRARDWFDRHVRRGDPDGAEPTGHSFK